MELAELVDGRELVQTRARDFHPRLVDRQINAHRESRQAEEQNESAPFPRLYAKKPERFHKRNHPGRCAEQGQI
jgi:hypothetical protein